MSNNIGGLLTAGGVSPSGPQTNLSQFTMGEGEVANAYQFGRTGTGMSTMETQGSTGPAAGFALQQGEQSLANTAAEQAAQNASFKNFASGLGGIAGKLG